MSAELILLRKVQKYKTEIMCLSFSVTLLNYDTVQLKISLELVTVLHIYNKLAS